MSVNAQDEWLLRARVKQEIRARMRQLRRVLPPSARAERSARIAAKVASLEEWARARTVLLYASMHTEVDTSTIEERARIEGKSVACPRIADDGSDLEIRVWEEGVRPFEQGRLAPEPPPDAPEYPSVDVDLVIVPALALDERGARIGYGKGFYDRLLARIPWADRVGVVFDFQLISEVPETAGDQRVDVVVTDARWFRVLPERHRPKGACGA